MKDRKNALSALAFSGMITGALTLTGCDDGKPETTKYDPAGGETNAAAAGDKYKDIHACAGYNSCKGLGGCKVTAEKLAKLAEKRGIPVEEAGKPHDCAGLNECKGLGGCHVDAEKFAKLKAKQEEKKAG